MAYPTTPVTPKQRDFIIKNYKSHAYPKKRLREETGLSIAVIDRVLARHRLLTSTTLPSIYTKP